MAENFGLMFVDLYDSRLIEWVTEEIPNGIVAYMKNGSGGTPETAPAEDRVLQQNPPVPCGTGGFLKSRTDDQRRGTYI